MDERDNLEEQFRKEILKNKDLTKEEIEKLRQDANANINFMQKIDEIKLPTDPYVIFTDGDVQLLYEKGEFYEISSVDSKKERKKKTKKEATDMYLNYFIRYELNPILDQKGIEKEKVKENKVKVEEKDEKDKVKEKSKQIVKDDLEI